jgi:hypothetical protein
LVAIACLGLSAQAFASHARPKGASPVNIRLVPAFEECFGSSGGMTHGPPLAVPSCSPTIQSSTYLTMNAPDRSAPYNTSANGSGLIALAVSCLQPGTTTQVTTANKTPPCSDAGDQEDVKVTATFNDIRCVGVASQGNCATGAGGVYNGKLLIDMPMRVTDHRNGIVPNPAGVDCSDTTTCTATTDFISLPIGFQCVSGTCNYTTSADLTAPGLIVETQRMVVNLGAVEVQDAGLNGNLAAAGSPFAGACPPACQADTDANTTFLTQGLFVP